jgi:hypothetical protein
MAINDRNDDGSLIVRELTAKGGDRWEKATDDERISFQIYRKNGGLKLITPHQGTGGWTRTAGGGVINRRGC